MLDAQSIATAINTSGLAIFLGLSVWLSIIDWREHRLPNKLVAGAAICALASHIAQSAVSAVAASGVEAGALESAGFESLIRSIVTAAVCFALYLALHLASRTKTSAGLGAGDVKLAGVLGLYLGWISIDTAILGIAAGFAFGAAFSLVVIAAGRGNRRSRVAFGPWMLAGAWLAIILTTVGGTSLTYPGN